MTKRDYFITYCVQQDLAAIYRYAMMDISSGSEDKPIWERSEILEKWLNQPMDMSKWNEASNPKHSQPMR